MIGRLTSNIPPQKIRYHHIVHDLQVIFEEKEERECDFNIIHAFLSQHYGLSLDELLLQGIQRAYRQIVEGV